MKLNKERSAEKIGRHVLVFGNDWSDYQRRLFGHRVTKKIVERILANKPPEVYLWNAFYRGGIPYPVKYRSRYIQIGCQKFYLTRIQKLLGMFS